LLPTHTAEHVRPTIGWTDDEGIGVERAFNNNNNNNNDDEEERR
jgi:hypothetical protein